MKPKHQRLLFVVFSMVLLCVGGLFALRAFRDNLVFFYSPSELTEKHPTPGKLLRVGGLVKTGSVQQTGAIIHFIITDGTADTPVTYEGLLPNLFREGQGVIAEGRIAPENEAENKPENAPFIAEKILAKHDEKYMPKEVVESLKRSGQWRGGEAP